MSVTARDVHDFQIILNLYSILGISHDLIYEFCWIIVDQ